MVEWSAASKRVSKPDNGDLTCLIDINAKSFQTSLTCRSLHKQAYAINSAFLAPLDAYELLGPLERLPLDSNSPEYLTVTEGCVLYLNKVPLI